ncbi:hypothetical protein L0F51_00215 [Afifella sp. H1R]|uniref:hypothetical protein n=1 Tax=Afifella sp. H1R TaxID=2908841 RepID=UPI001F3165B1|nr:hypothetical protein [Afifella sp. H1R]MCF1502188.1 hypothetical protein [Afifella sp. H1R]
MHMNLLHDAKIVPVAIAAAAGQTLLTTDVVDTQGFESVAFVVHLGDVTDTAELTLTGFTNETEDTVEPTELADNVTFTAGATDADNKLLVLDLHKPRERYAYATLARGTANAAVNGIIAVLYNAHQKPVAQAAEVIASAHLNDPDPA